jgi:hypothetical protein
MWLANPGLVSTRGIDERSTACKSDTHQRAVYIGVEPGVRDNKNVLGNSGPYPMELAVP